MLPLAHRFLIAELVQRIRTELGVDDQPKRSLRTARAALDAPGLSRLLARR